jgi:hypothetical protein
LTVLTRLGRERVGRRCGGRVKERSGREIATPEAGQEKDDGVAGRGGEKAVGKWSCGRILKD